TGFVTDMELIPTLRGLTVPEMHENYSRGFNKTVNLNIAYNRSFGPHSVSVYTGYEQYNTYSNNFYAFRRYYISNIVQTLDAGGETDKTNSGGKSIYARKSWMSPV
ncbi:MAG: hypothetical protein WAQ07_06225, partial [Candidatus Omnitrophota bacterium]